MKRGAIAAIGVDYYNVGRQTGNVVVRILRRRSPARFAVAVAEKTNLYVNPTIAKKMGLTIPEDVVSQADEVVNKRMRAHGVRSPADQEVSNDDFEIFAVLACSP